MKHSKTEMGNLTKIRDLSLAPIILPTSHKKIVYANESESKDQNFDFSPISIISLKSCSVTDKNNVQELLKQSSKSVYNYDEIVEIEEKKDEIDVRQMEFSLKNNFEPISHDCNSFKNIAINSSRFICLLLFFSYYSLFNLSFFK